MNVKGIAIGGAAGFFILGGPLGALFGAVLGHQVERELRGKHTFGTKSRKRTPAGVSETLANAYATLEVAPSASDDEVKRAYRRKAKKYHPDALRAQGLSEGGMKKATNVMARVNAAWTAIKEARHL